MQTYKIGVKQLLKRCNKNYTYLTFEIGVPTGLKTKKKKKIVIKTSSKCLEKLKLLKLIKLIMVL